MTDYHHITDDVIFGQNVKIASFVNLYGCKIGHNTKIGAFVEIQKNAIIGKNCKISSHTFICEGVTIKDNCFIGHSVVFINDNRPQAVNEYEDIETETDWQSRFVSSIIENNVSIGSNVTILGGITIGKYAIVGAGSVVTRNVPEGETWVGNPARCINKCVTCD